MKEFNATASSLKMPYKSLDIHHLGSLFFFSVFLVIFCHSPACSFFSAYRTVNAATSLCLDCLFLCFKLILALLSIFSSSITSLGSLPYNSSSQVVLSFLLVQGGSSAPAHISVRIFSWFSPSSNTHFLSCLRSAWFCNPSYWAWWLEHSRCSKKVFSELINELH